MGNTINFSGNLIIAFGGMAVVLAALILYAISLVVKLSKMVAENQSENNAVQQAVQSPANNNAAAQVPVQAINDSEDEEDRLVAALAASALAAQNKPDSHFRISRITRIK